MTDQTWEIRFFGVKCLIGNRPRPELATVDLRVCKQPVRVTFVGGGVRGENVVIVRNNRSSLTKRGERIRSLLRKPLERSEKT